MWDRLPHEVVARIVRDALHDLRDVCSLRGAIVIKVFRLCNNFWKTHSWIALRSLDEIERGRRLGAAFKATLLRSSSPAVPRSDWTFVYGDGASRMISARESPSLRSAFYNAIRTDHPHPTFAQWIDTASAWNTYEAKALGGRYARHRKRKRSRALAQPWIYESSSDSGSEWYASDQEGCIELHPMRGTDARNLPEHARQLHEGKRVVLKGTDGASMQYARAVRAYEYEMDRRPYQRDVVILPLCYGQGRTD